MCWSCFLFGLKSQKSCAPIVYSSHSDCGRHHDFRSETASIGQRTRSTDTESIRIEICFGFSGQFGGNVVGFIQPIINFLIENKSPVLANIYPYFAYADNSNIDLSYALFTSPGTVVNDNGRQYSNLFDVMLDAHYAAQSRRGGSEYKNYPCG